MLRWIPIGLIANVLSIVLWATPSLAVKSIGVSDGGTTMDKVFIQDASQDPIMKACLPVATVEQIFKEAADYSHGALLIISGDKAKKFMAVVNAIPPKTDLHADQVFISISEDPKYPNALVRFVVKGVSCGTGVVPAKTVLANLKTAFQKLVKGQPSAPVVPPVTMIPPTPPDGPAHSPLDPRFDAHPDVPGETAPKSDSEHEGHVKPWDNAI
jgi:hypothetical protein